MRLFSSSASMPRAALQAGLRLVLAVVLSLSGLGSVWAANYADPAYQAAVADAKYPTASEISHDLTPIVAWNPNLIWEGGAGASRVKMVSLTGAYYDNSIGQNYVLSFGELWVTAAPELKQFFQGDSVGPDMLRLEQLLGLPPEGGYTRIVEFWVDPADLFRPSADPEITDTEAGLSLPAGYRTSVTKAYRDWFNANWQSSFESATPYPWTQLGYTYDWGSSNHEGLSEFVIKQGSTVGVSGVWDPLAYFSPWLQ